MARRDFDPATVTPDGRAPAKARLFDGSIEGPYRGSVNGETPRCAGHRADLWQ